jgi:hypothetical protein
MGMQMRDFLCAALAALLAGLAVGCVFGPRQLEKGHLAYNDAVRVAADDELLLNIVRLRYLDTASRFTFFHLAEFFRLALSPQAAQAAPVLTLPVGAP